MQESDLPALSAQVLWAAFALAAAFGAIAQRTQFCTMGAVADIVTMGDWSRMRMWLLAIAVAVLGFNAMVAAGWMRPGDSLYAAPRLAWLAHALGGAMFGFGMVLASGCGSKTLVRLGGGSLKALVVLGVLAFAAYATMRGITAVWRDATVDRVALTLPAGQDLPSLAVATLGLASPRGWAAVLGAGVALVLLAWVLARPEGRRADTWLGGAGIGAVVVALWWVSGRLGHVAEHPLTLEPAFVASSAGRMESFSFVAPLAYVADWLMLYSDRSRTLTIGVVTPPGVVLGSAAVALAQGSFRWEGFGGVDDLARHLAGGALMGVGGVTALGCTVGQGISGVSTLSLGSALTLGAIVLGAVAGLRWQQWWLERELGREAARPSALR